MKKKRTKRAKRGKIKITIWGIPYNCEIKKCIRLEAAVAVVPFYNFKLVNGYVFSQLGSKATNSASLAAMSDIGSSPVSKPLREPRRGLTSRRAS
jgi:hypothetical protein